ncbi:MAG: PIG-L family deacetylase [Campylobacteraceae bacterium]|nr:PIG-L family deacetylase [Campylobacteraceae bacterium]
MNNKVLALAVHPDDETLGCGGTLLKHRANGDEIHWLIATEVKASEGFTKEIVEKRNSEIEKVASSYSFNSVNCLGLSTMRVDEYSISELVSKISEVFKKVQPNIVYLPFKSDVHSDHRKIFEAAYSCTKIFRYHYIKKIYMMETLSETEFAPSLKEDSFVPNVFVDISEFFEKKLEIMRIYESELGDHPFPRSLKNLKALATLRGATAGCEYAESFMLLKEIQ